MVDTYTINGGEHHIRVTGSMADNGKVQVTVNDETQEIYAEGTIKETPATYEVTTSNGIHVRETPAKQIIERPDGLKIEKTPATKSVTLPDGTTIKETPSTMSVTPGDSQESDTENSDSETTSKSTTSIQVSSGNVTIDQSSSTAFAESEDTTPEIVSALTPGGGLLLLAGLGYLFQAHWLIGMAVVLYAIDAVPALIKHILTMLMNPSESDEENTENDLSETEQREEELKNAYLSGDLTETEFESALDRLHLEDETTDENTTNKEPILTP